MTYSADDMAARWAEKLKRLAPLPHSPHCDETLEGLRDVNAELTIRVQELEQELATARAERDDARAAASWERT